ncbi:hypothetical protein RHMOL_Rhmol13G0098800 [Rhododendron molle]|uniref:Uncharacterized protein n=1 Tax=Rhododendron molle TaxID=49168 RepID=A0ACC0L616_RHOML|nr:hypothetical protein RHMOL_Rhmol13G0098800 [Rhododendron molle]
MSKALFFFFFSHIWYSHFITFFPLPRPHYRPQLLLRKEERTLNQTLQFRQPRWGFPGTVPWRGEARAEKISLELESPLAHSSLFRT